ncbi:uncharacterized protein DNG_05910 [Cephalotrichum gorgonifer]|uniref:Uncharacterized protein n=1 Tax=Cephalotrichum gorgonifer TaxID=2041049 RepID=A0AAE8N0Q6_9PEZI|nr:uncharacterized protein DNG_05910 [Cephalotrichum gorgonifer]
MPSVSPETLERLERLCKTHRIEFISVLPRSQWPSSHTTIFADVAELGDTKFDQYTANAGDDEPWKAATKTQAGLLVEKVRRLRQRNESTWRLHCEPLVFARLEAEVVCKDCRKRLWRSAIEASRAESSSTAARRLQGRQRVREPCRCPRASRPQDLLEAVGLNRIFGHREDEPLRLDPDLAKSLKQDSQRPDAIFGLRQTRNIENLLNDTPKQWDGDEDTGKQLHELLLPPSLPHQSLSKKGDELLFPFLALEAKSGSSDSDWHAINMQTAFPIKAFLDMQNRLNLAMAQLSTWRLSPLVWFFSNRGEDWRVSMAYMENEPPSKKRRRDPVSNTINMVYRIVDVWRGSLSTYDGAIQLLLLVDYVFDWARDVYRENVLKALRILASGENDAASTAYSDTNIFSLRQFETSTPLSGHDESEEYQSYISLQNQFTSFDQPFGVVRHATFIESRYFCLLVTADNVQTLLQSMTQTQKKELCWLISSSKSHHDPFGCNLLDLSTLNAMEEHWTGTSRIALTSVATEEERFYSVVSCTYYLSERWHQVRELHVIAISQSAWAAIASESGLRGNSSRTGKPFTWDLTDRDSIIKELRAYTTASTRQSLRWAINRKATKIRPNFTRFGWDLYSGPLQVPRLMCKEMPRTITVSDNGKFRNMVHYIYSSFKKGNLEPQEPFIRLSKRFVQQHKVESHPEQIPLRPENSLWETNDGYVLVQGEANIRDPARSRSLICVYIVGGDPVMPPPEELYDKVKRALETRHVHVTTRNNGRSSLAAIRAVSWNWYGTYRVCTDPFKYLEFLLKINGPVSLSDLPITSGSLRHSRTTGSYLFDRTSPTWHDIRFRLETTARAMFVVYKLVSSEVSYWREVAKARSSSPGVRCCELCAGPRTGMEQDVALCGSCTTRLEKPLKPTWFDNILRGKTPFPNVGEDSDVDVELDYVGWAKHLAHYPRLDEPWENILELQIQWKEFCEWENGRFEAWRGQKDERLEGQERRVRKRWKDDEEEVWGPETRASFY